MQIKLQQHHGTVAFGFIGFNSSWAALLTQPCTFPFDFPLDVRRLLLQPRGLWQWCITPWVLHHIVLLNNSGDTPIEVVPNFLCLWLGCGRESSRGQASMRLTCLEGNLIKCRQMWIVGAVCKHFKSRWKRRRICFMLPLSANKGTM